MKKLLLITALLISACLAASDSPVIDEVKSEVKKMTDTRIEQSENPIVSEPELSEKDKQRAAAYAKILDRDFNRFLEWFPGEYDNMEQVYFNGNLNIPEEERHGRIHHIFTPVNLPNFPGSTFYIEQYQNNDPADVYRQRIYSFEPDYEENAIKLTIYIPEDAEALLGAYNDLSKLDGLVPEAFTFYPGCEVYWRYKNDFYHGYMKEGACRVKSKRSGKILVVTDDLQLSKNSLWIRDEAVFEDGSYVYGNKARIHHKNNRATPFNCWVAPRKKDGEYGFVNNLQLHDQGGWVRIESEEYEYEKIALRMRNVVWPSGTNRPSRVLYLHRDGDDEKAVSYAWTSPDEPRLGINLRWVQVSCTQGGVTIKPGINLKTGSGN